MALGEPSVRPEIVDSPQASVEFEELRHPCIFSPSADFIPNSVSLGGKNKDMVLLTGPNVRSPFLQIGTEQAANDVVAICRWPVNPLCCA